MALVKAVANLEILLTFPHFFASNRVNSLYGFAGMPA